MNKKTRSSLLLSLPSLTCLSLVLCLSGCGRSDQSSAGKEAPVTKDLSWCSEHGDLEGVKGFLTSANINGDGDQTPPLHLAAKGGQIGVAEFLLNQGAEINKPDTRLAGWTPVHYAASSGQTEMIAFLVEKGAKIDIGDEKGEYPIHTAAFYGHINTMKKLMDAGSKPDQKSEPKRIRNYGLAEDRIERTDYQPIHAAARGNQPEVIRFLIGLGITSDTKDANGSSPLDYALLPMGWTPSRAETIRLVDRDGEFEKAAANTISTEGYYVTDESPPRFIRFMPEEMVSDGGSGKPYLSQRAVISFGPRGGTSPREVAKWLYPYNEEAAKQGKFISGTYKVMKGYVTISSFDSTYMAGRITLSRNNESKELRLSMQSGSSTMQEMFPGNTVASDPDVVCRFVSWK